MKQKLLLMMFVAAAAMTSVSVQAQDIIVKRDGTTIKSRVVEIGEQDVVYKDWPQGQRERKIKVSELLSITFENGEMERFNTEEPAASTDTPDTPDVALLTTALTTAMETVTSSEVKASDFDFMGLYYAASFDAADHGVYGYMMHSFFNGVGLSFGMKTNFFIEDSDYACYMFGAGPNPCAPLGENVCIFVPLCFFVGSAGTFDEESLEVSKEFTVGADLTPSIGFKSGHFMLTLGFDISWSENSSKLGTGFFVALGANI